MSRILIFVVLCILCNSMQSNAMTEEEETATQEAKTTNNAFASIVNIREDYKVQPSLIYDKELVETSCAKKSIHLTLGPFTEDAAHNEQFWDDVIFAWMDKLQSFFNSQWVVENTDDFVDNKAALLYFLYISSTETQRVFMTKIKNPDDGSKADRYNVTTYFHPILPTTTTDSVIAFKFVDALSLLNSARKFLNAPELCLDSTKTAKAVEILKSLQHTIREFHAPRSDAVYPGFVPYAEGETGQDLQLLKNSGLYSIFAYKIPDTEDMNNYLTKYPYALVKQLIFTEYANSIQQCNKDESFYIQIRRDFYQLLNRRIMDIGIGAKVIGNRYCLLVFYFGIAPIPEKQDMPTLDKSTQNKEFNFKNISSKNPRYNQIMSHMTTLPILDLQKNMVRYKEEDMLGLKGVYMPSSQS